MVLNRLKLNRDKTELLLISSRYRQSLALSYLQVGEEKICSSNSVRNLGVHFDRHARMHVHVKNVCQASFYHLRNISKIRRYLSQDTTEILIPAYITSKLDNCNSLLFGLPTYMINKFQTVQNAAARIVTFTQKTEHITPVLRKRHWLPVQYRMIFKVLLLVFKGLNGLAPAYISELLHYRTSSRSLQKFACIQEYISFCANRPFSLHVSHVFPVHATRHNIQYKTWTADYGLRTTDWV